MPYLLNVLYLLVLLVLSPWLRRWVHPVQMEKMLPPRGSSREAGEGVEARRHRG